MIVNPHCLRTALLSALALLVLSAPAAASVVRLLDLDTLARRADVIVRGTTTAAVGSLTEDRKQIHTVATVRVSLVLKGAPASDIEVRTPGGTIGDLTQVVNGAPQFAEGQEVILFLHRVSERRYAIEGFAQGKYDVVRSPTGGVHVMQDLSGLGILGTDGVIRPGASVAPVSEQDFLARIQKALQGAVTP